MAPLTNYNTNPRASYVGEHRVITITQSSISKSYRDYKQDGYATLTHKMSINKMAMPTPNSQDEYKQDGHGHAQQ